MHAHMWSIDPGAGGTGIAMWNGTTITQWKSLRPAAGMEWLDQVNFILSDIRPTSPCDIVVEYPQFHQSPGGMVVARSGALVKLSFFVGALYHHVTQRGCSVLLVTPSQWKGQLTKQQTQKRIRPFLAAQEHVITKHMTEHVWDAIGIGLWARGLL